MNPGIHLLHKPVGPTSFSVVQSCIAAAQAGRPKRAPKLCHGGTLDPFAHGLLLVLVGQATKLFEHLHAVPKTYVATVRWGVETDNGDPLGKAVFTGDSSTISAEQLDATLATFVGWQEQTPHATSAKRVGGERAYVRAHRGEDVVMPASRVYLHEARWMGHDLPRESTMQITARGGYYVRALARDLGRLMGCGAHLTTLYRTAIGPYVDPGPGRQTEVHGRELLPWAATRVLSDYEVGELRQDRPIVMGELLPPVWALPANFPEPEAPVRAFHRDRLVFLLRAREQRFAPVATLLGGL